MRAVLPLVALVACSDVPSPLSSEIASRDVRIALRLAGTPTGTRATGTVTSPAADMRLVEGDRLVLQTSTTTLPLPLDKSSFSLDFPAYGGEVRVALARPDGRGRDVEAKARLSEPFVVEAPRAARLSAPIEIRWSGARDATTTVAVTGACVTTQRRALAFDSGSYVFVAGELERRDVAAPCVATATVEKASGAATQTTTATFEVGP